jgi:hypothetical protein
MSPSWHVTAALLATALVPTALVATTRAAQAEGVEKGSLGLGLIIGEPTGLGARYYF